MPSLAQRESQTCDLGKFLPSHQGGQGQSLAGLIWKERKCGHVRSILSLSPKRPDRAASTLLGGNISILCPHAQVALGSHTPSPNQGSACSQAGHTTTHSPAHLRLPAWERGAPHPVRLLPQWQRTASEASSRKDCGKRARLQDSGAQDPRMERAFPVGHQACPAQTEGPRRTKECSGSNFRNLSSEDPAFSMLTTIVQGHRGNHQLSNEGSTPQDLPQSAQHDWGPH